MNPTKHPRPRPERSDGWTTARQVTFLDALARTRSVAGAARAAGMSRESAHRLRKRDPLGLFAALWDQALRPAPTARMLAEVDEGHRRTLAAGCFPLAPRLLLNRAAPSNS